MESSESSSIARTVGDGVAVSGASSGAFDECSPTVAVVRRASWLKQLFQVLRPQHWIKNSLVFVPLLLSHQMLDRSLLLRATIAFVAFCLCASAAYLVNDLTDLEADRRHPHKRRRPFASGDLPATWGLPLTALLLALGIVGGAATLPLAFTISLLLYVLLTSLYSAWLKRLIVVDVVTLAALYALRVFAGGFATAIPVSKWLLAFSIFFFLSLAFAKRCAELRRLAAEQEHLSRGRGYLVRDLRLLDWIGPANGYLAGMVFVLYIHSGAMKSLYKNELALWMICPLYLYWITRLWRTATRGKLLEDPVEFVLRDPVSIIVGIMVLCLLIVATLG